ncbi:MAG: hypothetical protein J7L21_07480 [Sulfurimonas sp.]|nr:hypothetical protein [Sulfurimonas sp.]
MTVLFILGLIAVAVALFMMVSWINTYSQRHYNYEFFNIGSFIIIAIGYGLAWYGWTWFNEAVDAGGDILNGQILVGIGVMLVSGVFLSNIRNTSLAFGFFAGMFQLVLFVPLSVAAAFAFIVAVAWMSETKPVYNIN